MATAKARREAFFDGLPDDELFPWEVTLRKSLLETLGLVPVPFAFAEWVDRRVGGEIELLRDEAGQCELKLRGAVAPPVAPPPGYPAPAAPPLVPPPQYLQHQGRGVVPPPSHFAAFAQPPPPHVPPPLAPPQVVVPPPQKQDHRAQKAVEAFFNSLPGDDFTEAECNLRGAIHEYMAKRDISAPKPTLGHLNGDMDIAKKRRALCPKEVSMKEWIERRIGGEIDFKGPSETVILTDEGEELVKAVRQAMGKKRPEPAVVPPPIKRQKTEPVATEEEKAAFFASLPDDSLLDEEISLREALLEWLKKPGKAPGNAKLVVDAVCLDKAVKRCTEKLLKRGIILEEWIEHRVGGEFEIRTTKKGKELMLRDAGPAEEPDEPPCDDAEEFDEEAAEAFWAGLPGDSFTEEEEELREAIIAVLEGGSCGIRTVLEDPKVGDLKQQVLPPGCHVSLKDWIEKRIGGEIATSADHDNLSLVDGNDEEAQAEGPEASQEKTLSGRGTKDRGNNKEDGRHTLPKTSKARAPRPPETPPAAKIFIGNMPAKVTKEMLYEVFGKYGSIIDHTMMPSKNGRTSAFITYSEPRDARRCVAAMAQGYEMRRGQGNVNVRLSDGADSGGGVDRSPRKDSGSHNPSSKKRRPEPPPAKKKW